MELLLEKAGELVKAEFISEITISNPNLLVVVYQLNSGEWLIRPNHKNGDIRTDDYGEYYLAVPQAICHGYFIYKDEKRPCQVALCPRKVGYEGLEPIYVPVDLEGKFFQNHSTDSFMFGASNAMLVDFVGFNSIRRMMGLEEYTLPKIIERMLHKKNEDNFYLNLNRETSYFSINPKEFNCNDLMTIKGFEYFLEEQYKKDDD